MLKKVAEVLEEQQKYEESAKLYERAISGYKKNDGLDEKKLSDCMTKYERVLAKLKETSTCEAASIAVSNTESET
jgi:hypothetical protein